MNRESDGGKWAGCYHRPIMERNIKGEIGRRVERLYSDLHQSAMQNRSNWSSNKLLNAISLAGYQETFIAGGQTISTWYSPCRAVDDKQDQPLTRFIQPGFQFRLASLDLEWPLDLQRKFMRNRLYTRQFTPTINRHKRRHGIIDEYVGTWVTRIPDLKL